VLPGIAKLPEYLASISYRNPGADPSDKSLFQFTNNTDLKFFQWMQVNPKQLAAFNASMAKSVATERASTVKGFADIYPFQSVLGGGPQDEVVLVDVGGGHGQALEDIRKHLPGVKGKMVLEDLPETVKDAIPLDNVEVVPYDFFIAPQPVKGNEISVSVKLSCCIGCYEAELTQILDRSSRLSSAPHLARLV
jgi:hypothetical protein